MKRALLILAALALVACAGMAQTVYIRDTAVVHVDPVTTDVNGDPLLAGDVVAYDWFLTQTVSQNPADHISLGTTAVPEITFDIPSRIDWWVGVRYSVTDDQANTEYSIIAWSSEPIPVTASGPFGYAAPLYLPDPTGLEDGPTS